VIIPILLYLPPTCNKKAMGKIEQFENADYNKENALL